MVRRDPDFLSWEISVSPLCEGSIRDCLEKASGKFEISYSCERSWWSTRFRIICSRTAAQSLSEELEFIQTAALSWTP